MLLTKVEGPRIISLAGRSWKVTAVDWSRRRAYVEPGEGKGLARWIGAAAPRSYALTDAMRRVLLGAEPAGVQQSRRAGGRLGVLREEWGTRVDADRTVVLRDADGLRWWTWAGSRGNAVLHAAMVAVAPQLVDPIDTFDNEHIALAESVSVDDLREAIAATFVRFGDDLAGVQPEVSRRAVEGLKFADLLPPGLAEATLAARLADRESALATSQRQLVGRTASA